MEPIREDEVWRVLKTVKNGKAAGPGGITMELIKYGGPSIIRILTRLFNQVIEGDPIPTDWKMSYISAIYKNKGNKRDPANYRGISVMASMSRILTTIIKMRLEELIGHKISEDQAGFTTGKSCLDNIFVIRQIAEKMMAKGKEVHMAFIDLEKAYDSVPINRLWMAMEKFGIPKSLLHFIKRMYVCKACVKVGNRLSTEFSTTKGLRQGCGMSPTLFKIFLEDVLGKWNKSCRGMGLEINDRLMHNLLFADDQVIIGQDKEDMEYMIRKLVDAFAVGGLKINAIKTEYMVIGGTSEDLHINDMTIKCVEEFKYLGSIIDKSGNCERDIINRVNSARKAIRSLNSVLWNGNLNRSTKQRILRAIIESILTYGSECWTMNERMKKRVLATEMDGLRRSMRISRLQHVRNTYIRQEMEAEETVIDRIEKGSLQWYGHVQRMSEERWPKCTLNWMVPGRRKRGRARRTWYEGIHAAMMKRGMEEGQWEDRNLWKAGTKGELL